MTDKRKWSPRTETYQHRMAQILSDKNAPFTRGANGKIKLTEEICFILLANDFYDSPRIIHAHKAAMQNRMSEHLRNALTQEKAKFGGWQKQPRTQRERSEKAQSKAAAIIRLREKWFYNPTQQEIRKTLAYGRTPYELTNTGRVKLTPDLIVALAQLGYTGGIIKRHMPRLNAAQRDKVRQMLNHPHKQGKEPTLSSQGFMARVGQRLYKTRAGAMRAYYNLFGRQTLHQPALSAIDRIYPPPPHRNSRAITTLHNRIRNVRFATGRDALTAAIRETGGSRGGLSECLALIRQFYPEQEVLEIPQ